MPDALIFDMPVELGLELMTIVGADLPDPEGELLEDKVDVVDGVRLGVFLIDLKRAHAGRIVDGRELLQTYLLAVFASEGQKLNVHLKMVARDLLGIALGVNLSKTLPPRGSHLRP